MTDGNIVFYYQNLFHQWINLDINIKLFFKYTNSVLLHKV